MEKGRELGFGKDSEFDNNGGIMRESGGKGEGFVEEKKGAKPRGRKRKGSGDLGRNNVDLDGKGGEIESIEKTHEQGGEETKESGDLDGKGEENCMGTEGLVKEKETDKMANDQRGSTGKELEGVSVNKRTLRRRAVKLEDRFCDQVEKFFEKRKDGLEKKLRKGLKKEVEEGEDGSPTTDRGEEPDALETVGKTTEAVPKQRGGGKTDDNVISVFIAYINSFFTTNICLYVSMGFVSDVWFN